MTPDQDSHSDRLDAGYGRGTASGTVQLLVADSGNRTAIREMLSDRFDVETSRSVGDADLYLIEDRLLSAYREELRDRVERAHPEFRPVVVIRRETADLTFGFTNESERERSILVDDVVDAPIDRPLLVQRLHSLLVRRQQSRELSRHVATLSARERDLRRFERGVEAAGNGIAITDRTGTIEYVNPAFERITAFSEGAIIGQTPRVLQPDGATAVFDEAFWRTMTDRGEWEGEVVIERTDETRCVADITVTAFGAEGDVTEGFVLVMNDITERIQREQQLQSREKELDLLRQILTRYLRHNLRNDLNVILGYARLLADADSLPEGHRRGTEQIVAATKRLMERSDTARTYSTLLERDAELSAYDLSDIVTDAVRAVREQYPAVDVEFDVPDTCRIQGRTGIRDAVEDLIENAVRHNDASSPWLRIRIRERDGVRLTIDDNGPGIPDFEIAALERGDETPLSHSQGIGLWLCKWVIEGVEGELSFEPTDAGTRVIVEFPPSDRVSEGGLDVPDLKERERRLQTVLDRMTDAIVEVDASWDVAFLDRRAEEILGVDAEEILGRNFWEVFSDARGTQFEAVFRDVMESRSSASIEEYYSGIGGWLEIHVYPEFGGGLSLYARDVTERNERKRELEQAQERIEFALKATETTIWEWDFQDDSITTHPDTHIGFDSVVTTIDDFMEGVHPDDQRRLREELRAAIDAESSYQTEFRVPTDDGFQWIEDYGELRRDDCVPTRMIGIARDVTERKERERALQERVKELTAIYDAARVFETTDAPLEEVLETFIETVRESFQHPDVAEVRLAYDEIDVSTAGFEPGGEMLSTRAEIANGGALRLDVAYRTEPSDRHGDPFLPEEKRLLDTLTTILKGHLKRRGYLKEIERTRDLLTNAERLGGVGAWEVDPSTEEAFWTEGTRRIFGVGEEFDPTFEATLEFVHPDDRETVSEAFDACVETGESFDLESRIHTADGKERWVHIEGESIGHAEERQAVRGHLQDITERKDRNRRYEAIFNQTYQFTGLMEPDGTLIEANRAALEFGGVTREQVLGQKIWNTYWFGISEETQQQTRADVKRAAAGEFVRRELEVRGEDGTVIIDFSIRPVTDEHEDVVLLVPEGRNITERKERERELERAKQRLDVALREARAGIWEWDLDTDELYWSDELLELLGVSRDEIDGEIGTFEGLLHPDDVDRVETAIERAIETGEPYQIEQRIENADGEYVWFDVRGRIVEGEPSLMIGVGIDITERKAAERRLREEQQFVRGIFRSLPDPLYTFDTEGYPIRWNETFEAVTGYSSEEIENTHITDLVPDDETGTIAAGFQSVLDDGRPVTVESAFETKDGVRVPYEFAVGPLEAADGTVQGVTGIGRNIVDRAALERRLKALNRTTQELMSAETRDEVLTIGVETTRDLLGLRANSIHLYDEGTEELVPAAVTDAVYDLVGDPPTFTGEDSIAWRVYQRGETLVLDDVREDPDIYNPETPVQSELYLPLGEYGVLIATSRSSETFDERDVLLGEILAGGLVTALEQVDRTDQLRTRERELTEQNDRLEEFVSIVSHDLRNPLTVAEGRLQLAFTECDSEHLEHVERAHGRMRMLIRDLLALAREGEAVLDAEAVDLASLTESCWKTVETGDATLVTDIERTVKADESRLKQLFENLIRNAVEHGGESVTVTVGALADGFYVEDDGPGIPADERENVFEAGYSTREDGTGFGLSIVTQVVEALGWSIRVTDGDEGGARFEIADVEFVDE